MEVSEKQNILTMWFVWHFSEMPRFLFFVWKNYINFGLDFFSTPRLLATLFSPWRAYRWSYPRGFDMLGYANTFVSNIFSRIIGAICRLVLIVLGFFAQIFIFIAGMIMIIGWLSIPFFLIGLILFIRYL